MSSSWLITSIETYGFKFGWVELILSSFESSSSISVRVSEESHEDRLKFKSVLNNKKSQMWILICFGHEYRVSSKCKKVRFWNWYACHAGHTMNFMWRTEVLIKNSKIWCMDAQVQFWMLNNEETWFNPKWSPFMSCEWWVKFKSQWVLSMSWSVQWRKVWVWWDVFWVKLKNGEVKWKLKLLNQERCFHLKIWF